MKTLKPRNGLVTVRLIEPSKESQTDAGIIIPHTQGHIFELAVVLEVGAGIWLETGVQRGCGDLLPGQTVLIKSGVRQGVGQEAKSIIGFEMADGEVHIINQHDIMGILEDADTQGDEG